MSDSEQIYEFRGKKQTDGLWVYGGVFCDIINNECYIITSRQSYEKIIPETLGKKYTFGDKMFYHGDLVVTSRKRRYGTPHEYLNQNININIEDFFNIDIGIVLQSGPKLFIADKLYTCGIDFDEIDPTEMMIVGNIFDSPIDIDDIIDREIYCGIKMPSFKFNNNYKHCLTCQGYFYDKSINHAFVANSLDYFEYALSDVNMSMIFSKESTGCEIDYYYPIYEGDKAKVIMQHHNSKEFYTQVGTLFWNTENFCYSLKNTDEGHEFYDLDYELTSIEPLNILE